MLVNNYSYHTLIQLLYAYLHYMMNSIYIHIPFCNYKCDYCNFFILQKNHPNFQANLVKEYIQALHREIDHRNNTLGKQNIKTIYIG